MPASLGASFLAGAVAVSSMPPYGFWPSIILALAILYYVYENSKKPRDAFLCGWLFGFGFHVFGLYWIGNALLVEGNEYRWAWPLAVAALPALLAAFPATALFASKKLFKAGSIAGFLGFVAILSLCEWLRGHILTGFPWNLPAYAWAEVLPVAQSVSVAGTYFLSLMTIFWGASAGLAAKPDISRISRIVIATVSLTSLAIFYTYGYMRLKNSPPVEKEGNLNIQIVQPSIAQKDKWDRDKLWFNFNLLVNYSYPPAIPEDRKHENFTTLVLWPETAITSKILDLPAARAQIKNALKSHKGQTYLLTGILRSGPENEEKENYYNSLLIMDENLNHIAIYNKSHLVPFGEYIPLHELLPFAPLVKFKGMSSGKGLKVIPVEDKYAISPSVCYEIIFPGRGKDAKQRGNLPRVIVNVTNDAWYGDSTGPYQHYKIAIFRAIEENSFLLRAANNGISAIIDPYGREKHAMPLNKRGFIRTDADPSPNARKSIYSSFGDMFFWAAIIILISSGLYIKFSGKQGP